MLGTSLWILLFHFLWRAHGQETDCYADKADPYLMMASKTGYHFVYTTNTGFQNISDCTPIQIWMIVRHGTRYPSSSGLSKLTILDDLRNEIINNHESLGNGLLCDTDLENLKQWTLDPNVTETTAGDLSSQGHDDMSLLAERVRSSFPQLFLSNVTSVDSENYKFRSTNKQRTIDSMEAFMMGLFDRTDIPSEIAAGNDNDTLLQMNKYCARWTTEVDENPLTYYEEDLFTAGPEFENLILNVSIRLGFSYNISTDQIQSMYDMCRFDKAWKIDELSPWCAVFSDEELRVIEYQEDLSYYYQYGYGTELNSRVGCTPVKDFVEYFEKLESDDYASEPKGIFYFTHSAALQTFMTAMGFAQDPEPLVASNYNTSADRQWRISKIGSFATNVAAVFYKCNSDVQNKVMFYLAEEPVLIEGCPNGLCSWEDIKTKLVDTVSECTLDFCTESSANVSNLYSMLLLSIATLGLIYFNRFS